MKLVNDDSSSAHRKAEKKSFDCDQRIVAIQQYYMIYVRVCVPGQREWVKLRETSIHAAWQIRILPYQIGRGTNHRPNPIQIHTSYIPLAYVSSYAIAV